MFSNYKKNIVNDIVSFKKEHHIAEEELVVKPTLTIPLELYAYPFSKAMTYDGIANMLQFTSDNNVLYLGDSKNDNPAFKKTDNSIGIRSNNRNKTSLECKYYMGYEHLDYF